jgi:hypothetical protein
MWESTRRMKLALSLVWLSSFALAESMICKHDAIHEVCRFSDSHVVETICTESGCSVFHWTKAQAAKLGNRLAVHKSYDEERADKVSEYMRQGYTFGEAQKKVHDDVMSQPDPGVEKARAELCKKGILPPERCKMSTSSSR